MSQKFVVLSLLFFLAFFPVAAPEIGEFVHLDSGTEQEASSSTESQDLSSNTKRRLRSLSRLLRRELSGKLLPGLSSRADQVASVTWTKQTSLSLSLSKQDLYQQIKVYRI
jgi:hypothetical protein